MSGGAILIIEDEPKLGQLMADFLRAAGFTPHWRADGRDIEALIGQLAPQLIILDLMLPGRDGAQICQAVRLHWDTPIIMVTARVEEQDRLLGLEIGADDYICKPFSLLEMVARVKVVLRRVNPDPAQEHGALQLLPERYQAVWHGVAVELTPLEFRLLQALVARPGRVLSRDALMDHLYIDNRIVEDRTIDSHVKKIRRKFEGIAQGAEIIQSVYGAGYKYEGPAVCS